MVEYELRQVAHQQKTFAEMIDAMGGKSDTPAADPSNAIRAGGNVKHEVGGRDHGQRQEQVGGRMPSRRRGR
jgi:hypothetical protein